jgi:O-antigen ligase/polysaccharide polymerase Wzy-like membrane protein
MSEMTRNRIDGWGLYLALLVCLIPVVVPSGPARLAFVDGLIVLGLGAFAVLFLTRKEPIRVPFLAPVIMITVGSLAAMVNAESPSAAFLAMAQDAYLFLWFIMLVQVLRDRDLTAVQGTWIAAATVIALYGIFIVITEGHLSLMDIVKPTGKRAYGTFYDPNMFAGYLVMSLFVVLSMGRRLPWWVRWGSMLTMLVCIVATKSNGGMLSLVVGFGAWLLMRAWTRNVRPAAVVACALLVASLGLGALWMNAGVGIGASQLSSFESNSFLARAGHSSEGRFTIWKNLQSTWARTPLGIGPGNSTFLTLSVEDRLRPNSLQAKEAHNDYLAYAIERGPLGLLGLLVLWGSAFGKLGAMAKRSDDGQGTPDRDGPMVAALTGALAASAVHALTIEVLHFRHFWMLMAMICAIDVRAAAGKADRRPSTQGEGTWSRRPEVAA